MKVYLIWRSYKNKYNETAHILENIYSTFESAQSYKAELEEYNSKMCDDCVNDIFYIREQEVKD